MQHVLVSRIEGKDLEVIRGAERKPGLEQWRRQISLCDLLAAGRSLDDSRQILSLLTFTRIEDVSTLSKLEKTLNMDTRNALDAMEEQE